MGERVKRAVLNTPSLKLEFKRHEKDLKTTQYYQITKKYPSYLNTTVFDVFSELPPLNFSVQGDGRGRITNPKINIESSLYIGEVSHTLNYDGYGHLIHNDGSYFQGYFSRGRYCGQGRLITAEGDVYEGTWAENVLKCEEGKIMVRKPYSLYTGQVEDSLPQGKGILYNYDQTEYEGEFHMGRKEGQGKLRFPDGSWYEGEFKKDKQTGNGTLLYKDGSEATGTWLNNRLNGIGCKTWIDGSKYEGEFKNGAIDGKGLMEFHDGRKHDGFWNNEIPHGIGTEYRLNGTVIHGHWNYGKLIRVISEKNPEKKNKRQSAAEASEISKDIRELEEKASEVRRKMLTKKVDKFGERIGKYEADVRVAFKLNEQEKVKRQNDRLENKILKNLQQRQEVFKIVLRQETAEERRRFVEQLNMFHLPQPVAKYERILRKRQEAGVFDFNDPLSILPESLEITKGWIEIDNHYYCGEVRASTTTPSGRGMILGTKEIYEGFFLNGRRHGLGREITTRSKHTGFWVHDKKQGFGTKIKSNYQYVGDFVADLQSGQGTLVTPDAIYTGDWLEGKQSGMGVLKFRDGKVYKGSFRHGVIQGFGCVVWPNGKAVMGNWDNGEVLEDSEKRVLESYNMPEDMESEGEEERKNEVVEMNEAVDVLELIQLKAEEAED